MHNEAVHPIHHVYALIFAIWRPRRWARLCRELSLLPGETILDIGGTAGFWATIPKCLNKVVVANVDVDKSAPVPPNVDIINADGCSLPFADKTFDLAFSNSVIEHVGSEQNQLRFANEIRRVGCKIWVQTPAREFFIEPHFIGIGIHWLPDRLKRFAVRWTSARGWIAPRDALALAAPDAIRLLNYREVKALFPDCEIIVERFLGMPKSFIAVRRGVGLSSCGSAENEARY